MEDFIQKRISAEIDQKKNLRVCILIWSNTGLFAYHY